MHFFFLVLYPLYDTVVKKLVGLHVVPGPYKLHLDYIEGSGGAIEGSGGAVLGSGEAVEGSEEVVKELASGEAVEGFVNQNSLLSQG